MKTLTATLLAAQKAGSQPIAKVVFTKASQTTRGYSRWTANALLEIQGEEEDLSSTATIIIDNSDEGLTSLDLRGYQVVISLGYVTAISETAWQASTAYSLNNIVVPATANGYKYICTTAGTSGGSAPTWGTSLGGTTADGAGALVWTLYGKTGEEYIDRAPRTVRTKSVSNAPTGATYSVATQGTANGLKDDQASAKYTLAYSDTQTVKTHIAAVLGATRAAYNHTTAYTLVWDSEDSLVDTYKPADSYSIGFSETRHANLRKLLDYVRMVVRVENDGKYHFFEPRNAKASTWVANTAYALRATVKPTTANNHIYVCTTAGTSHATTEPTWPTTVDATVSDGTAPTAVVWTLTYDYQYDSADGNHIFYAASEVTSIVIPNKITVQSDPETGDSYTGTATDTESNALESRQSFVDLRLASSAQALSIANALLAQAQIKASQGVLVSNINCGQEIHDLVRVHDAQLDKYYIGNVGKISFTVDLNSFSMQLWLGRQAAAGIGIPSMGISNQQWQLNLKNVADLVYVYSMRLDSALQKIENLFLDIDADIARLWQKLNIKIQPLKLQLAGARYVRPGWNGNGTNTTNEANRVFYIPIFVSESTLYTKIGVEVTTAAAGATVGLAIYTWADGLPNLRILNAGTVSVATTGIKTITISQTLERGYYFLACRCTSATAVLRGLSGYATSPPVPGFTDVAGGDTEPHFSLLYVDGTLDDPAAAPTGGATEAYAFVFLEENA